MKIRDAAAVSGLSIDTIRFYERAEMLPEVARDKRGWRNFDSGLIEWLQNLEKLRATGMPLKDMKRFAELVHGSADSSPERISILTRHAERLAQRRAELDACQTYLRHKIAVYSAKGNQKNV
jgi:MerR family transcriptional regulator, aldehyde-responsive regulator